MMSTINDYIFSGKWTQPENIIPFYVDCTYGDDRNNGDENHPFKTIPYAVDYLVKRYGNTAWVMDIHLSEGTHVIDGHWTPRMQGVNQFSIIGQNRDKTKISITTSTIEDNVQDDVIVYGLFLQRGQISFFSLTLECNMCGIMSDLYSRVWIRDCLISAHRNPLSIMNWSGCIIDGGATITSEVCSIGKPYFVTMYNSSYFEAQPSDIPIEFINTGAVCSGGKLIHLNQQSHAWINAPITGKFAGGKYDLWNLSATIGLVNVKCTGLTSSNQCETGSRAN